MEYYYTHNSQGPPWAPSRNAQHRLAPLRKRHATAQKFSNTSLKNVCVDVSGADPLSASACSYEHEYSIKVILANICYNKRSLLPRIPIVNIALTQFSFPDIFSRSLHNGCLTSLEIKIPFIEVNKSLQNPFHERYKKISHGNKQYVKINKQRPVCLAPQGMT